MNPRYNYLLPNLLRNKLVYKACTAYQSFRLPNRQWQRLSCAMADWSEILSKDVFAALGFSKRRNISRCPSPACGLSNFVVETEPSRSHGEVCYVARCVAPGCVASAWYVCGLCGSRRIDRDKLTKHHVQKHATAEEQATSLDDIDFTDLGGGVDYDYAEEGIATVPALHPFSTHLNGKSLKYLQYDLKTDGGGANMLVSCAFEQSEQPTGILQPCEVEFHLYHMKVLNDLNTGQREKHARLMCMLRAEDNRLSRTFLPKSVYDFQTYYLDRKYSVAQNVPRPKLLKDVPRHARVSVGDCIEHFLAFTESPMEEFNLHGRASGITDRSITKKRTESRAAQRIRERVLSHMPEAPADTLLLLIERWSDDFERNNLRSAGRKSIWVCTITIMAPFDRPTDTDYTFVVGLGWKGDDHGRLESLLQQELDNLSCNNGNPTYMYSRRHGKTIPVVVETLVEIFDRPELSSVKGNVHHRGMTGEIRDYSAILKGTRIQSCTACHTTRLGRLKDLERGSMTVFDVEASYPCSNVQGMSKCADYELACVNGSLDVKVSDRYPKTDASGSPDAPFGREAGIDCVRPVRLSSKYFVAGALYTWYNMVATPRFGGWTLTEATEYWKYLGIQDKYLKEMKALVKEHWKTTEWLDATRNYEREKTKAVAEGKEPPIPQWNCPPMPKHLLPASWFSKAEDYLRYCCVNPVMHCLFLGVIRTGLAAEVKTWLKAYSRNNQFLQSVVDFMEAIKSLSIDWCRLESFGPGWVSDTCLALARCFKVVYGRVRESCGNYNLPGLDEFEQLVAVTNRMVALIMDDEASIAKSNLQRETIKCFLSLCREWWLAWNEPEEQGRDDNAFYRTKPNFFSMLNFVEQSLYFGPARLYWDGNRERYIQTIKPEIGTPRKNGTYLHTLMDKVHKKVAVNNLVAAELPSAHESVKRFQAMKTYSSKEALQSSLEDSMPLSGALIRNGAGDQEATFFYRLKAEGTSSPAKIGCAKATFNDAQGRMILAAWHAPVAITDTNEQLDRFDQRLVDDYILLAPWEDTDDNCTMYYVFSRGWKERTKEGKYSWPLSLLDNLNQPSSDN